MIYGALLAVAGSLFVASAATRALNFDESLALRSGWLHLEGVDASPAFVMPATLMYAGVARLAGDPGTTFVALRLLVASSVLGALIYALTSPGISRATGLLGATIVLLQAAFATHAYEFRYDAALVVAWLVAFRWWMENRDGALRNIFFGILVAWTAFHHLKGVYLAAALVAMALPRLHRSSRRWMFLGMAGAGLGWVGLLAAAGLFSPALELYAGFLGAAAESSRTAVWAALGDHLRRDLVWWLVAVAALAATVWRLRRRTAASLHRAVVLFALIPLGFVALHPKPWPYLLVPAAPFLALAISETAMRRRLLAPGGLLVALAAYPLLTGHWIGSPYAAAFRAPMGAEVASLRALRQTSERGDRVVDPSGLAYFLPPCRAEWYVDALFEERADAGTWMARPLSDVAPDDCRWALVTIRLNVLPPADLHWIRREFVLVGGSLLLRHDDPRLGEETAVHQLPRSRLESYWW